MDSAGSECLTINCVWEHNGNDTLLYAVNDIGAYARGDTLEVAKSKMPEEIRAYRKWLGDPVASQSPAPFCPA